MLLEQPKLEHQQRPLTVLLVGSVFQMMAALLRLLHPMPSPGDNRVVVMQPCCSLVNTDALYANELWLISIFFVRPFGYSISLSGDGTRLAVGSLYYGGNYQQKAMRGRVFIYDFDSIMGDWSLHGSQESETDDNNDLVGNVKDFCGTIVELSSDGSRVLMGCPQRENAWISTLQQRQGYLRVIEYNDSLDTWIQKGSDMIGSNNDDGMGWGASISGDGNVVAGGAVWHVPDSSPSGNDNIEYGQVKIYKFDEGANDWTSMGADIVGTTHQSRCGASVSLSSDGNTVSVGFPRWNEWSYDRRRDAVSNHNYGKVIVYTYTEANGWVVKGDELKFGHYGAYFGLFNTLSNDGLRVVVPDAMYETSQGEEIGRVRAFDYDSETNTWKQMGDDMTGEQDKTGWTFTTISGDGSRIVMSRSNVQSDNSNSDSTKFGKPVRLVAPHYDQIATFLRLRFE
eukprot:UC4_evm2s547